MCYNRGSRKTQTRTKNMCTVSDKLWDILARLQNVLNGASAGRRASDSDKSANTERPAAAGRDADEVVSSI